MSRIYLDFSGLKQLEAACAEAALRTERVNEDFDSIIHQLDWEIRMAQDIEQTGARLEEQMQQEIAALKRYEQFLLRAAEEYRRLNEYEVKEKLWESIIDEKTFRGSTYGRREEYEKIYPQNPSQQLLDFLLETMSEQRPSSVPEVLKYSFRYTDWLIKTITEYTDVHAAGLSEDETVAIAVFGPVTILPRPHLHKAAIWEADAVVISRLRPLIDFRYLYSNIDKMAPRGIDREVFGKVDILDAFS